MSIDSKTVKDVAHLARLEFENEGEQKMIRDMNNMLGFVEKLNELNTDNIEPLIYMTDETDHLRDDVVKDPLPHKDVLKNAPKHDSDYFKVPKVVEKK
ncbi:MAG TPA: Asp-tRNA(Asn)/Glu-tRNA(Gln) amidotransferase subunit GatC [Bacteroidia bacterium]|jgi:aspartyl-tRNA(Asn)/glutamyl-tRNA(Gln) amidotransferase subunit C|nr:Asp-tRNA(Asn)/Glu-tRNA(Gln) amidotransferase subunit GatC [Bacteroidia bacterium]